jgi:hypothetical protein
MSQPKFSSFRTILQPRSADHECVYTDVAFALHFNRHTKNFTFEEPKNEVRGGGAVGGQPDFLNALARCNDFCTGLKRQRRNDYSASRPSIPDAESQPFRQSKADSNPLLR